MPFDPREIATEEVPHWKSELFHKKLKKSIEVGGSWGGSITAKWSAVLDEPGRGTRHKFKNDMVHGNNWQAI